MKYRDLREFIAELEVDGRLKRIQHPVSPHLEMTEIADRVLRAEGLVLLFGYSIKFGGTCYDYPVLANLFGTPKRVTLGTGADNVSKLRKIGQTLTYLKEPEPPKGIKGTFSKLPLLKDIWSMAPSAAENAPCQEIVWEGEDTDLYKLSIQHCQLEDVAPPVTWGLTVMRSPYKECRNLGIYRRQLVGKNELIMRWLPHHGGALGHQEFRKLNPGAPYPVTVVLGCDSTAILGAVTPAPDTLGEYQFAGLLRDSRTELVKCIGGDSQVSAHAEIISGGVIHPNKTVLEGLYGDHTDYYNEQDHFPVFTVERVVICENPIYHSTYTGEPSNEPTVLGVALNEVFVPLLQKQLPEITDFYLPSEGCSCRTAIVNMKKQYAGCAKRVMMGCWLFLRQFVCTKSIIVVGDNVNVRDWKEVIWTATTRMDPMHDTVLMENMSIDYLDFASSASGPGGKTGSDTTNKWPGETNREWGRVIKKGPTVTAGINEVWKRLGLQMSFLLEFILQIMMGTIGAMFEDTVETLRPGWRKRGLSEKGLAMLTMRPATIIALIVHMVIPK